MKAIIVACLFCLSALAIGSRVYAHQPQTEKQQPTAQKSTNESTEAEKQETTLQKSADELTTWARKILDTYKSWGESIDRGKLADSLGGLNQAIFNYRSAKGLFLDELEHSTIGTDAAKEEAMKLEQKLREIRTKLNEPLSALAQHSEVNGDAAARALDEAANERLAWLEEFLKASPDQQKSLIKAGRKSLDALNDASKELAKTIEALKQVK